VNARRSPRRVLASDSTDERPDLSIDRWTSASVSALPSSVEFEALAMPTDHGLGLQNGQLLSQGEVLESEFSLRLQARSGGRKEGVQQGKHRGRLAYPERRNINDCADDGVLRRHRKIIALPMVGGLHHRYTRRAA
jgi:hypothetical protein